MEPLNKEKASAHYENEPENSKPAQVGELTTERPTAIETLRKYWMAVAAFLVLILFAGLFLWLQAARKAAFATSEPVAATTENIEYALPARSTDDIKIKSPSTVLEERRRAEQEAQHARPLPTEQEVVNAFVVDTVGQATHAKQQLRREEARMAAANMDTIETTVQEPSTGVYRTKKVVVARRATHSNRIASDRTATREEATLPAYDTDGTPFETDPEVLRMLSAMPEQTRQVYEQTTGRRYRDTEALAQVQEQAAATPGADGFNTFRAKNTKYVSGKQAQQLTPDVFFKCTINGEQNVRTGSVVIMRLLEDAVVGGVTFPKNMIFAGLARVQSNRVTVEVDRLGATRVKADIFDFSYMPGIMIEPEKKIARDINQSSNTIQQQSAQEIGMAIDRSASAANSFTGVAGRVAASAVGRIKPSRKLRQVLLPDGYPILITTAAGQQLATE